MSTLLTIGTFDIPHVGHAAFLRRCEAFADHVVVGVNSDDFVAAYKGAAPLYRYAERASLVAELGYVVLRNTSAGRDLIEKVAPDAIAIGTDWMDRDYLAQIDVPDPGWLAARNIALVYLPYTPGISSSAIRERVHAD